MCCRPWPDCQMQSMCGGLLTDRNLLPPLASLRAFEAVGRLRGVRRAAKELAIDHAVVSRHIRSLEAWVGIPLVIRTSTGYDLTESGEIYHQQICAAMTAISNATGAIMKADGILKLRIQCIPGFATLWLSERIGD